MRLSWTPEKLHWLPAPSHPMWHGCLSHKGLPCRHRPDLRLLTASSATPGTGEGDQPVQFWVSEARGGCLVFISLLFTRVAGILKSLYSTCVFVVSPMNIIDLLAILPFYLELSLYGKLLMPMDESNEAAQALAQLKIMRSIRLFRVRFSRGSPGVTDRKW